MSVPVMLIQPEGLATAFFYRERTRPRSLPFGTHSPGDSRALTETIDEARA